MIPLVNQAKLKSYQSTPKFMFGYKVPRNYKETVLFDQQNGNTRWQDCTELEMIQLAEYKTFKDLGHASCTRIPVG
jgi:hypothetical protein